MKPLNRYQRVANDKETRMLRLWQTAVSPADAFYAQMAEGAFNAVRWAIAEKISEASDDSSHESSRESSHESSREGSHGISSEASSNAAADNSPDSHASDEGNAPVPTAGPAVSQAANNEEGRFLGCSELTSQYYMKLIFYYNNALSLFNEHSQALDMSGRNKISDILSGIKAVILSRVQSYGDKAIGRDGNTNLSKPEFRSPARVEKKMLLSRIIRGFSENFDAVSYRSRSDLYNECFQSTRKHFAEAFYLTDNDAVNGRQLNDPADASSNEVLPDENPIDETAVSIFIDALRVMGEKGFPRFYELYTETLANVSLAVNEFYKRNADLIVNEQLANEHDILRNLATIQAQALERESGNLPKEIRDIITIILNSLRMAYHTLTKDLQEIQEFYRSKAITPRELLPQDYNSFAADMEKAALESFRAVAFEEAKASFFARYSAMRDAFNRETGLMAERFITDGDGPGSPAVLARTTLNRVVEMTKEIGGVFDSIKEYYEKNESLSARDDLEGKIAEGISETVGIKSQILNESAGAFLSDMAPLMEALSKGPETPPDIAALCNAAFVRMSDELIAYLKEDRRASSAIKKYLDVRPDSDAYREFFEEIHRPAQKTAAQLDAKIIKFKKEQLLYEISTFEEIQNYSVPRLREDTVDDAEMKGFVGVIDECGARIFDILKKNGIERICPEPHDMFNGREHEVLMAEENPDFKKAEIIKMMNGGYRQGAQILLRANVIAAK